MCIYLHKLFFYGLFNMKNKKDTINGKLPSYVFTKLCYIIPLEK